MLHSFSSSVKMLSSNNNKKRQKPRVGLKEFVKEKLLGELRWTAFNTKEHIYNSTEIESYTRRQLLGLLINLRRC